MASERKSWYEDVYGQDFPTEGIGHGWIQWKGTNVCMDVHCECGYHDHVDADFFYAYECRACGRKYAVGQTVKLILLKEEQLAEMGTLTRCAQIADSFSDKPLAGFDGEKQWKASEKIAAAIRSMGEQK